MRAAWSGYAKALQLQSAEVEEIDVFSWGCGLQIADRPALPSHLDLFDRFEEWRAALLDTDAITWFDRLPTAIGEPSEATDQRPEEPTSELPSLMPPPYSVVSMT